MYAGAFYAHPLFIRAHRPVCAVRLDVRVHSLYAGACIMYLHARTEIHTFITHTRVPTYIPRSSLI